MEINPYWKQSKVICCLLHCSWMKECPSTRSTTSRIFSWNKKLFFDSPSFFEHLLNSYCDWFGGFHFSYILYSTKFIISCISHPLLWLLISSFWCIRISSKLHSLIANYAWKILCNKSCANAWSRRSCATRSFSILKPLHSSTSIAQLLPWQWKGPYFTHFPWILHCTSESIFPSYFDTKFLKILIVSSIILCGKFLSKNELIFA